MKSEYSALIESPEWQKTRKEIIKRDVSCVLCGSTEELQVHHRKYSRPFKDKFFDHSHLVTLCRQCHEYVTNQQRSDRYRKANIWPDNSTPIFRVEIMAEEKRRVWL